MSHLAGGRFDLTVWPLLELWRRCEREHRWPDEAQLAATVSAIGYRRMQLDPTRRRVRFCDPRLQVDLSSVAKGAALDASLRAIREHEAVSGALLDAGGELAGWRADGGAFLAGIAHPDNRSGLLGTLELSNQAVATSGQSEARLIVSGEPIGHLFDLRCGLPIVSSLASVSVAAPGALLADLLSTASFVLGTRDGSGLLTQFRDVSGLFVLRSAAGLECITVGQFPWRGRITHPVTEEAMSSCDW
jgi:thiamine biosynthesis lipoprotein